MRTWASIIPTYEKEVIKAPIVQFLEIAIEILLVLFQTRDQGIGELNAKDRATKKF